MTLPRPSYGARKQFNAEALKGASGTTMRVALYLHDCLSIAAFHDQKWITPKQGVIACELGMSRRSVVRAFAALIERRAFCFQQRFRDQDGGHFDLPYRIAFVPTGVTPTGVTTEARKRPRKTASTGVTDLSIYRCDRSVTLNIEDIEAGTGPRRPCRPEAEPVSRVKVPSESSPVAEIVEDQERTTAAAGKPAIAPSGSAKPERRRVVYADQLEFEEWRRCGIRCHDNFSRWFEEKLALEDSCG